MARGHPPPHCENTQVLREAIAEDDDGDEVYQKGMFFMSNYMNRYGFQALPLYE